MKKNLSILLLLCFIIKAEAQKHTSQPLIHYVLTPFNGMHSGFNADGTQQQYWALVSTMYGISVFTPSNRASKPPQKFGYFQMTYAVGDPANPKPSTIVLKFKMLPNVKYKIILSVSTNVTNSIFTFSSNGQNIIIPYPKIDNHDAPPAEFTSNATGGCDVVITTDHPGGGGNTFLLTKITIEQIQK